MRAPHSSPCAKICGAIASLPTEWIRLRDGEGRALDVVNIALRLWVPALYAAHPRDHFLQSVKFIGSLACMRVAGQALARFGAGNIHVMRRRELHRVLTVGNLVI